MKMLTRVLVSGLLLVYECVAPPVIEHQKKDQAEKKEDTNDVIGEGFNIEYKRYVKEVLQMLESSDDFKQLLDKADPESIKSGKVAKELEFVHLNIRSKLDELKRLELERLRQLAIQLYEESNGLDENMKIPDAHHVDSKNVHTFEAEDLRKFIVQATGEIDARRKEEFKKYEMYKELEYQQQLKHLDEKKRSDLKNQHELMQKKHKEHPALHHPGSKQQYQEVWQDQDHLDKENFNTKTFFHLHDLDGNGVWDTNEVKVIFRRELDKLYDPKAPEDDNRERLEEMERMREHLFNETDTNQDRLISFQEFLEQTKQDEFEQDEGWKTIDERKQYDEDEYRNYAEQHNEEIRRRIDEGFLLPQQVHPIVISYDDLKGQSPQYQHRFPDNENEGDSNMFSQGHPPVSPLGYYHNGLSPQVQQSNSDPNINARVLPQQQQQYSQHVGIGMHLQEQQQYNHLGESFEQHNNPNALTLQEHQQYHIMYHPEVPSQQQLYNPVDVPTQPQSQHQQHQPNVVRPQQQQENPQHDENDIRIQHNNEIAANARNIFSNPLAAEEDLSRSQIVLHDDVANPVSISPEGS